MRVAVITPIPTPYRDPLWNVVAEQPGIDLDVYYCAPTKADRPWELSWERRYNIISLPAINLAKRFGQDASCYWNRGIVGRLHKGKYDALVMGGYNHITMLVAFVYARLFRVPYFLMNEVYLTQPRKKWRVWVKDPLVKWIVRNAAGFFPTGTLSSEYLMAYGADKDTLTKMPNAPDVDHFYAEASRLRTQRSVLRKGLGFGDEKVILFVSRLIKLKRVDILLEAFAALVTDVDARLVILGDGIMKEPWEALSRRLGLENRVEFRGFMAPADLPKWYVVSDLFVLPSEDETWSVVVLEALASGVPVVITDMVGCYRDMINDPRIGRVVPACDVEKMAEALRAQLADNTSPDEVDEVWRPVRETVRHSQVARRFVEAVGRFAGVNGRAHA